MQKSLYVLFTLAGASLLYFSWRHRVPVSMTETLGFLTGAVCVWLIVKENVWNWPVGIANNIFYVVVFWRARLYADMSLQFIYIALGCLGLYRWLYGGKEHEGLYISRISAKTALYLLVFIAATVSLLTIYLKRVQDAAPFLDASTAVLSICAQYLLTKKILENWWLWIVTDTISVGLYLYKSLTLTAVLYLVFLVMCITGLIQWRRTLRAAETSVAGSGELAAL
jgi:nicotinamide mononucleotide transporter